MKIHFKNYQIYDEKLGKVASMAPLSDSFVALVAPRVSRKGMYGIELGRGRSLYDIY
jgi:hypothetical protein